MPITVEAATQAHLEAINSLYNHYVRTSHATFDVQDVTLDQRRTWFDARRSGPHRVFVASNADGLAGFASSGPHRPKPAYLTSVETSVYVAAHAVGRGVGKALYGALFEMLPPYFWMCLIYNGSLELAPELMLGTARAAVARNIRMASNHRAALNIPSPFRLDACCKDRAGSTP